MISTEKFAVVYTRKDFSNNWIKLEREFYFKDEALYFADKMQKETEQKTCVYKKVIKYERIP